MNDRTGIFAWIDQTNTTQQKWAINYWRKKGINFYNHTDFNICSNIAEQSVKHDSDAFKILFKKTMRAAWNQKQNRSSLKGRKAYSFIMSTDIEKKLKQLVGNAPISQTLEELITDAHQFIVQTKTNLEQQYKEKKESLQRNSTPSSTMKKKIQKLTAVHAQEEQIIAALLLKICTHEIILARNKIIELTLSTEEHELALEKTTKNLERYKKQIESDIGTLQFNEKFIGVEILNINLKF